MLISFEEGLAEGFSGGVLEGFEVVGFDCRDSSHTPSTLDDVINEGDFELVLGVEALGDGIGEFREELLLEGIHYGLGGSEAVLEGVHFGAGFPFRGFWPGGLPGVFAVSFGLGRGGHGYSRRLSTIPCSERFNGTRVI